MALLPDTDDPNTEANRPIVVVGAGMAGVQTAVALRERGHDGEVLLLGAEPHQPYDRPPLSKDVLLGKAEHSRFDIDFPDRGIELLLGRRATGLGLGTPRAGGAHGGRGGHCVRMLAWKAPP